MTHNFNLWDGTEYPVIHSKSWGIETMVGSTNETLTRQSSDLLVSRTLHEHVYQNDGNVKPLEGSLLVRDTSTMRTSDPETHYVYFV